MTDIRDGNQQAPSFGGRFSFADFCRFAVNRVIEISGVFTVDGHQRHIGQVNSVLLVHGTHGIRQCTCQGNAGIRELVRHTEFTNRNFDLHTGIVNFAQYLLDSPHRLTIQGRRLRQFNNNDLPRLGRPRRRLGN